MGVVTQKEKIFAEAGIDVKGLVQRFMGNEALAKKFLIKFLEDKSFIRLKEAIENGNSEEAFKEAHTLKGVAGNLGLNALYECANCMTENLRGGDMSTAGEDYAQMEQTYLKAIKAIETEL